MVGVRCLVQVARSRSSDMDAEAELVTRPDPRHRRDGRSFANRLTGRHSEIDRWAAGLDDRPDLPAACPHRLEELDRLRRSCMAGRRVAYGDGEAKECALGACRCVATSDLPAEEERGSATGYAGARALTRDAHDRVRAGRVGAWDLRARSVRVRSLNDSTRWVER